LYLDVGSHPEYATPECDDVRELVAHDKAGERIRGAAGAAEMRLHEEGISGQVYLSNNTDSAGTPMGATRTTSSLATGSSRMADVRPVLRHQADVLWRRQGAPRTPRCAVLHLAARRTHLGRRLVGHDALAPHHQHARRAHADAERFRRLHVIVGDSGMSEWTTFMKVGITDLVLRMVEANTVRDLTLENPMRDAGHYDTTCTRNVKLANGRG
jgi:proteasome accessory factor A